jgi:O-acetylhomoserine/O-acetylserine sulfhydrylase-like pyridoxal-dependent enzyme
MERGGHVYTRITNPTNAVLEERVSALEGGVGAIATASGQAAMHLALATLIGAGSHIVASRSLYGGSHNLLHYTLPRFGIETTFVDPRDVDAFRKAIRPNTRILFGETLGNPGLDVLDVPRVAEVAHDAGLPLLVDSTFTTPYLMRPFDLGADLLFHSATKFLGGHGVAIGGVLVDGGRFDWEKSGRFPTLTQPYAGFPQHGVHRGVHDERIHLARAPRRAARFRRLHEPAECISDPAGESRRSHCACSGTWTTRGAWSSFSAVSRRWSPSPIPSCPVTPTTN